MCAKVCVLLNPLNDSEYDRRFITVSTITVAVPVAVVVTGGVS